MDTYILKSGKDTHELTFNNAFLRRMSVYYGRTVTWVSEFCVRSSALLVASQKVEKDEEKTALAEELFKNLSIHIPEVIRCGLEATNVRNNHPARVSEIEAENILDGIGSDSKSFAIVSAEIIGTMYNSIVAPNLDEELKGEKKSEDERQSKKSSPLKKRQTKA